jgi:hypothetical protein
MPDKESALDNTLAVINQPVTAIIPLNFLFN